MAYAIEERYPSAETLAQAYVALQQQVAALEQRVKALEAQAPKPVPAGKK